MDALPPIPTPRALRWREFRIQMLPVIVFLFVLLVVVLLWRNLMQPAGVVGEVEAVKATVTSTQEGLLADLSVDRFEVVTRNQPLGLLVSTDPDLIKASLAVIDTDLKVMRARMEFDRVRNVEAYHQMRLDVLDQKVQLASARANLIQASNEYQRVFLLYYDPETNLVSESAFDLAKAQYESLQVEVQERGLLLEELTGALEDLQKANVDAEQNNIDQAIKAKELEVELTLKPTVLKAPIDGIISAILRRAGEKVVRGEAILTISSPHSDRIVGYVRQPLRFAPTTNDTVLVRARSGKRQTAIAPILKVGAQMEPINPALISLDATRVEVGLPILVGLPPGLPLLPGEYVDLSIRYSKR
jgi:multidrug resistance efflux pump